jgi:hypothetical protein
MDHFPIVSIIERQKSLSAASIKNPFILHHKLQTAVEAIKLQTQQLMASCAPQLENCFAG